MNRRRRFPVPYLHSFQKTLSSWLWSAS